MRCLVPRVAREAQLYGGAQARRQARNEPLAVDVCLHLRGDVYAGDAFRECLQREAGVALDIAVGVAGEGAGGFGVLPRVAAVVIVEGEQAGMGEVVSVVWAGGELLRLPLEALQPLRVAPVRNRTLRCVGHRRFPLWQGSKRGSQFLLVSHWISVSLGYPLLTSKERYQVPFDGYLNTHGRRTGLERQYAV